MQGKWIQRVLSGLARLMCAGPTAEASVVSVPWHTRLFTNQVGYNLASHVTTVTHSLKVSQHNGSIFGDGNRIASGDRRR